jgi:hypothetical protein
MHDVDEIALSSITGQRLNSLKCYDKVSCYQLVPVLRFSPIMLDTDSWIC